MERVDEEGFLVVGWETVLLLLGPGRDASSAEEEAEEDWERAVIRVLTTQMGFVISTVAEPAMAPAIMDSMVVSFLEAREERTAARSKKARVHSYPVWNRTFCQFLGGGGVRGRMVGEDEQ